MKDELFSRIKLDMEVADDGSNLEIIRMWLSPDAEQKGRKSTHIYDDCRYVIDLRLKK